MTEKERDRLRKRAQRALNELWRSAHAEDTPTQYRLRLLQWFAELGVGKPKAISDDDRGSAGRGGIVILPDAGDAYLIQSGFDRFVGDAIARSLDAEEADFTD